MRGPSIILTIVVGTASQLMSAPGQPAARLGVEAAPVSQPEAARANPSSQPERWSFWTDCSQATVLAASEQSLWFGCPGALWRYDVKTRQIKPFSPLDGLPMAVPELAGILDGGRFVCSYGMRHIVWSEQAGWKLLADVPLEYGVPAYSTSRTYMSGRMLVIRNINGVAQSKLLEYTDKGWQTVGQMHSARVVTPIEGGFYMQLQPDPRPAGVYSAPVAREVFVSADLSKTRDYPASDRTRGFYASHYYKVKGQVFGLFAGNESTPWGRLGVTACLITPEKITQVASADCIGMDYRAGTVFKVEPLSCTADGRRRFGFSDGTGKQISTDLLKQDRITPIRDANGDVWVGPQRWDGQKWQLVVPPYHCEFIAYAADPAKVELDAAGKTWRELNPGVPLDVTCFDPKARTGWIGGSSGGPVQFVQFGENGQDRKVLRTIKAANVRDLRPPTTIAPDGNWWGIAGEPGISPSMVYQIDPNGELKTYPTEPVTALVAISSKGDVWAYNGRPDFLRYDKGKDAFVNPPFFPTGEFSFDFAGRRLEMVGVPPREIRIKRGEQWELWMEPRWTECLLSLRGNNQIWRNRIVARLGSLVAQYDAAEDEVTGLVKMSEPAQASFDRVGRVIIVMGPPPTFALVYDGDAKTPAPHEAEFDRLLAELDDAKWAVREAATRQLRSRAREYRALMVAALAQPDLAPEAKARIAPIMTELQSSPESKQGMFEQTHPPLLAPANR